jgi:uncharacterized membrane protein (DUF106 family)
MSESVLQILLILAYLAVGLIAITFPIYAITVNYLKQEKWETGKERKKRIENLKNSINELTKKLDAQTADSELFEEMQNKIKESKEELSNLQLGPYFLTARGAVLRPLTFLVIALIGSFFGIEFFYEGNFTLLYWAFFSYVIFTVLAVANLYSTLSAVEKAALRKARTVEFEISYETEEKEFRIKAGQKQTIAVGARPEEDVENAEIWAFIPPEIELGRVLTSQTVVTLQPPTPSLAYPNYNAVLLRVDFLSAKTLLKMLFEVTCKNPGEYKIPVTVSAKGVYSCKDNLILIVEK